MDNKDKLLKVVSYLKSVKKLNRKTSINISQYDNIFWQQTLVKGGGIVKRSSTNGSWMEIGKNTSIYDDFFKLYLKLQKECCQLEIVYGYGFLIWRAESKEVAHPLLTVKAELIFDTKDSKFILKPINNKINLEIDILEELNISNLQEIIKLKSLIDEENVKPEDFESIEEILKTILTYSNPSNLHNKIEKQWIGIENITIGREPIVYSEPLIIVRKSNNRAWKKEIEEMLSQIANNENIPDTIKALVDENFQSDNKIEEEYWKGIGKDLLFPLPYNKEQGEIVKKLSEDYGVVVEGPPGTGKSHTIANLICHLLAHGKRVLITSQTDNPLKLLINKVPEEIRPLCINIAGNDLKNLKEFDYSINKIIENLELNSKLLSMEAQELENQLSLCRNRQKFLYSKLREAEKVENGSINYCGKKYRLLGIAKWLKDNESKYSWIEDKVDIGKKAPITDAKFSRLIYFMSNTSKEEIEIFNNTRGLLYNIPSYEELSSKIKRFNEIRKNYSQYSKDVKDWCISYNSEYEYEQIMKFLENGEKMLEQIEGTWLQKVLDCSQKGETLKLVLQQAILKCNYYIKRIGSIRREISGHKIEIPQDIDVFVLEDRFNTIYKQYDQKGKINKLFKIFHSECQSTLERCFIDSKPLESRDQVRIVKLYIEQCSTEKNLKNIWNNTMKEYGAAEIDHLNVETLVNLEEAINKIDIIINWDIKVKNKIINSMKGITFLNNIDWYKKDTYDYLKKGILSIKYILEYERIKAYIVSMDKLTSNISGFEDVSRAIQKLDILSLKSAYRKIDKLKEMGPNIIELQLLLQQIYEDCPKLVRKILNDEDKLNMLTKYKNFSIAWTWRQFDSILEEANRYKIEDIEKELEAEKDVESNLIRKIIYKKSWHNQITKIEEKEKRSLYAWSDSVKRVGKGKGRNSLNYLKLAQKEMDKLKDVIPVWIMPINKVIETFSLTPGLFDVVIIDESSQCDIFAISALFRAKRAIIVGDDKQISPGVIGIDMDKIQGLIDKHLKEIPHYEWFDMRTSIYNTALRVFPNRIMLKEHFRCVPEIIEFSNRICYSNQIMPLRRFNSGEQLGSPIRAVKVEGERNSLKPINIKEAEALVNKIAECCRDYRYNGMSMGVISLLGDAQCEVIENLLKERIGEKEMIARNLVCGNAYSFQGDERDIIFLSMVIANNVKFTALTKDSDLRRFNVASSRARNQMWLFHSVDLKDLNENCVRAKLLSYCLDLSSVANKNIDLKNIFESQFQKDVYRMFRENGYEIKPQVLVGKYKIDFVLEGFNRKIAIECDGEKQSIESWEEEYEKKICLERVGWKFFKIKGSEFYRNPDDTMKKLLQKIDKVQRKQGIA